MDYRKVKISICQYQIGTNKKNNISKADKYIRESMKDNPNIIVLPECFVCPYDINVFKKNSECVLESFNDKDSPATYMLYKCSRDYPNVYIFGGSIIEKEIKENGDIFLYNTCLVFHNGKLIKKYRKVNLYKIQIDEHSFCEGDILNSGNKPTIVNTIYGKIGLGICYDVRFNDLAKYYQEAGCKMIIYPGSFNRFTGPKHWLVLQQARALDNQLFVISCSAACNFGSSYESYGKSYIISPWGSIVSETKLDKEEILSSLINLSEITEIRRKLPILSYVNVEI